MKTGSFSLLAVACAGVLLITLAAPRSAQAVVRNCRLVLVGADGVLGETLNRDVIVETAPVDSVLFRQQIEKIVLDVGNEGRPLRFQLPGQKAFFVALPADTWNAVSDRFPSIGWHSLRDGTLKVLSFETFASWAEDVTKNTHRITFDIEGEPSVVIISNAEMAFVRRAQLAKQRNAYLENGGVERAQLQIFTLSLFSERSSIFNLKEPLVLRATDGPNILAIRAADIKSGGIQTALSIYEKASGHPLDEAQIDLLRRFAKNINPPYEIIQLDLRDLRRRRVQTGFRVSNAQRKIMLVIKRQNAELSDQEIQNGWLFLPF